MVYLNADSASHDETSDRLSVQVYVGEEFCGEVAYKAGENKYVIACGGAVGDIITVKQPYNYLTLCEVQAFGEATEEAALSNVAAGTS